MRAKTIIKLAIVFMAINLAVYSLTELSLKQRVDLVLKKDLAKLQIHFDTLNTSQENIAYAISKSIIRNTDLIEILSSSYTASKKENNLNREKLYKQLKEQYQTAKKQGVLQLHFVDKNNISFLRVHKPSKFGDDLTNIREDFKLVNITKEKVRGFTQGRTAHGFRNSFPIFDKKNNHIGAMEISFSSERYQYYLNKISNIHSHFLVDKQLFTTKAWEASDMVLKYEEAAEDEKLMLNLNSYHSRQKCIINNKKKLQEQKEFIKRNINQGEKFSLYVKKANEFEIVSFLPIKNLNQKTVAWIVSYTESKIIKSTIHNTLLIRSLFFIISLMIVYLLLRQLKANIRIEKEKENSEKQRVLLDEILNTTDNIMIITDFKDIKFANDQFKSNMLVSDSSEFNSENNHNMLSIFIEHEGYLHAGLLKKNQTFPQLYKNTRITDRKVLLLNENFEPKAYSIVIKKLSQNKDYLVTLSDISKMQEELTHVENKAYIDGLTGVYNRNKFNELFIKELERIKRYKEPLCLAMIDIDNFKKFNDTYGHLIGDEVLITLAQTVNNNIRSSDIFARWGGEEFVLAFINTPIEKAKEVSLILKDKIENNEHKTAGKITASFGVTQLRKDDDLNSILKRSDEALYKAKENGRNRVEVI